MRNTSANLPGVVTGKPTWKQLLRVTLITIAAMPVTILLHELGHYIMGWIFGFPNLVLHYGSASHTANEQHFPGWKTGLFEAGGPLITILFTTCCCLYVARRKPSLVIIILGIAAPVRCFILGFAYFISLLRILIRGQKYAGSSNFDEYKVAAAFNISLPLIVGAELIFLLWAWWFLSRKIPGKSRRRILWFILIGIILGIALWVFIGPLLLP